MQDSAFFTREGRVECFIQTDKEGCLSYFTESKKLNPFGIRKKLQEVVRSRLAQKEEHWMTMDLYRRKNKDQVPKGWQESSLTLNQSTLKGYMPKKPEAYIDALDETRGKDEMVLIRYRKKADTKLDSFAAHNQPDIQVNIDVDARTSNHENQLVTSQIINGKAWSTLFATDVGEKNPLYKEIEYIQTRATCSRPSVNKPLSEPISYDIEFRAPLNDHDAQSAKEEIFYDFKKYGDDLELLKEERYKDYCVKQCLKMCYYIKQTKKLEILKMHAEFQRDDCNNVWFTYANKVHFRRLNRSQANEILNSYINVSSIAETRQVAEQEEKDQIMKEIERIKNMQTP
jgi:hypothetical protein